MSPGEVRPIHSIWRAGWPRVLPLRGSHRSGRAHIRASGSSDQQLHRPERSPKLSDRVTLTCEMNLDVFGMFPSIDSVDRCFALLHRVLRGEFLSFDGTIKTLRHPAAISPHFVSFAWRYLGCTRCVRSLTDECAAKAWSWQPGVSIRELTKEQIGLSQVPGEPQLSVCTCSKPTPAGLLAPDHKVQQRGPWYEKSKGSHDWVFRRSIAWLSD